MGHWAWGIGHKKVKIQKAKVLEFCSFSFPQGILNFELV
jgi:hypothetical protein